MSVVRDLKSQGFSGFSPVQSMSIPSQLVCTSLRRHTTVFPPVRRYLHAEGVVHRDLKPDNMLLAQTVEASVAAGTRPVLKLCDFGLACYVFKAASICLTNRQSANVIRMHRHHTSALPPPQHHRSANAPLLSIGSNGHQ